MKRTSVVSIIIAASIIVVGIIICLIGNGMAKASGNLIFSEVRGEDSVKTVPLSKDVIKISLDCGDADVNIYGSSSSSYIEFVNFRETFYSLTVNNTNITFKETPDMKSLFAFWENGFSFTGMRHLFNPRNYDNSKMKEINIYLSSDSSLKQFELSADETFVTLENLECNADYVIRANLVRLYGASVKTNSTLKINAGTGTASSEIAKIELKSCSFNSLNIQADEIDFTATATNSVNAAVISKSGSIVWEIPYQAVSFTYIADPKIDLVTEGELLLNGEKVESPFVHESSSEEPRVYSVHAGKADVALSGLSYIPAEEPDTPEETETENSPSDGQ